MIFVLDNYDSFTYNLVHLLYELEPEIVVRRNRKVTVAEVLAMHPEAIVLSPGPGRPESAGIMRDLIRAAFDKRIPMLGVCLGHQGIGEAFGARLLNIGNVVHGVATPAHITVQDYLFKGLPKDIEVGRYHSWVVDDKDLPQCLEVTSRSDDGYIMSLRHREYDIRGIQFHPESVLTPQGKTIINNWLNNK